MEEEKLEKLFNNAITDKNIEVLYVDYEKEGGYNYLRVYLEKKDKTKVSLNDCEMVSLLISDIADREVKGSFMLEVSSPGIERKLKKAKDFINFIGDKINVKTRSNINNSKKFCGILKDFRDDNIILEQENSKEIIEIPLEKVVTAKNIFDFSSLKVLEGE